MKKKDKYTLIAFTCFLLSALCFLEANLYVASLEDRENILRNNLASAEGSVSGNGVYSGPIRYYTNIHSIGIEWDLNGDENLNAVCSVSYKKSGLSNWNQGAPLFRVKYAWYYNGPPTSNIQNGCYGSIMFLTSGTSYDVKVNLTDLDGGSDEKTFSISTRSIPEIPQGGNTYYVSPGTGGGDGTEANPFKGISSAEAVAQPKDIFILQPGDYGNVRFSKGGDSSGNYIVWRGSSGGEALFRSITIASSNIWLESLFVRPENNDNGSGIYGANVNNIVVIKNRINGFGMGIRLSGSAEGWYIADNTIVGNKKEFNTPVMDPDATTGEGIELGESRGSHAVAWNTISRVGDGVSYPGYNVDVYGNDIFDTTDDAIELDRGGANNRVWGNRMANIGANVLSFQPMKQAPWYFIRNLIVASMHFDNELRFPYVFKFRVQDQFAFINNTVVFGKLLGVYNDMFARSMTRNNLFISSTGNKPIWLSLRYANTDPSLIMPFQRSGLDTKVDHNGYDWGSDTTRWDNPVFLWQGYYEDIKLNYSANLDEFYSRYGFEKDSKRLAKENIFNSWNLPSTAGRVEPTSINLSLSGGSQAIDAGIAIPNLSQNFNGSAPDLGAIESGNPQPHYGVRNSDSAILASNNYWNLDHGGIQPSFPNPDPISTPTPTPPIVPNPDQIPTPIPVASPDPSIVPPLVPVLNSPNPSPNVLQTQNLPAKQTASRPVYVPTVLKPDPKDYPLLEVPVTNIDLSIPSGPSWLDLITAIFKGVVNKISIGFTRTAEGVMEVFR